MKIHVLYVLLICHLHVCNYMYVHRYSIQSDIMLSYNMNHIIIRELLCRILIIMFFVTDNTVWIIHDLPFLMFSRNFIYRRPFSWRSIIGPPPWSNCYSRSGRPIINRNESARSVCRYMWFSPYSFKVGGHSPGRKTRVWLMSIFC